MNSSKDFLKYLGAVFLIFILPAILVALSLKYNGYLWQGGGWSVPGIPVIFIIWFALLYYISAYYTLRQKLDNMLNTVLSMDINRLESELITIKDKCPESWPESDKLSSQRNDLKAFLLKGF
jgi:hypothetical protein